MSKDDSSRRDEINAFAAMATGESTTPIAGNNSTGTFDFSAAIRADSQSIRSSDSPSEMGDSFHNSSNHSKQSNDDDSERRSFAQAGQAIHNSGTFSRLAPLSGTFRSQSSGSRQNHNLEAAALALADEQPKANRPAVKRTPRVNGAGMQFPCGAAMQNPNRNGKENKRPSTATSSSGDAHPHFGQIPLKSPMHAQEVLLQRPLFFGPNLPPRVLEEAKQIVDEALNDQHQKYSGESDFTPRIGQLPPGVRNLISAIKCYGFGMDILSNSGDEPSPYISVFCPRWSEDMKRSYSPIAASPTTVDSVGCEEKEDAFKPYDTMNTEDTTNANTAIMESSSVGSSGQQEDSGSEKEVDTSLSERDMFSAFARHGSDFDGDASESSDGSRIAVPSNGDSGDSQAAKPELSEQALFTQWVQEGKSPANVSTTNVAARGTFNFNDSIRAINTMVSAGGNDSDDDTVVGSEMKTKVGVNEHLNAALASLEDGQSPAEAIESVAAVEEGGGELTQVPLTEDGGRPLSNQELMNAHAPLFGVDDPPLPSESDLGNHETREEQQKSKEQRRIQAFIEKFCPHNVFGPLACPNPSTGPDDYHSWNSLSTPLQRNPTSPVSADHPGSTTTSPMGRSISSDDLGSLASTNGYGMTAKKVSQLASTPKGYDPRARYGWWNAPNEKDAEAATNEIMDENSMVDASEDPIQLPPVEHPSNGYPIQTLLEPSPEKLHKQNRPLSELHPATSLAQALPFLSDRPPSYRYLQVNTQAVAFPALQEEVEPLFCSLAIYHVETIAHNLGDRGMAPIPDLDRCGKVTETLNFDLIKNAQVEQSCSFSLSPYTDEATSSRLTSCGVFPLPSNLSVNNLYAIITVGKVISEGSDFEPYLKQTKGKNDQINIENLRQKAEKASANHGNFVMPFAFGVAPLLQVFGADVPKVPSSRAVQIPLFRFYAGNGERQIIDHIMVMLYPRADHRASGIGGPAPLTNGGTAMLVMRNFGYLGLHEVVNGKSSLAMDRLIDFTGEMQLRRKEESNGNNSQTKAWRSQYEAEPTVNGGRCIKVIGRSYSTLNAQELAPVPLLTSPHGRHSPKSRSRGSGEDVEPYFHTSFCNELLCYPRVLRNCQKGNIVVKVEMREIEWNAENGVFLAHAPSFGPVVHNLRRGPFLVQGAYTSCSARRPDPHFLDEFKLKLPLLLGNNESRCPAIFFSVYRLSFRSRKKFGLKLGRRRTSKKFDEITGDMVGESDDVVTGKDCQLLQLGCGFLPLEKKNSLLENGNHDVKISYVAKHPLPEFCEIQGIPTDTIVMSDFTVGKGDSVAGDESVNDDGDSQGSDRYYLADTISATSVSDRDTVLSENFDNASSKQFRKQLGMLLQVRIAVQSSIHSQNATLNEFLSQEPDVSVPLKVAGKDVMSFLRSGKEAILRQLTSSPFRASEEIQYESKKLLISTVDLARPDMCSVSDITLHLVRVCNQLWKVAVAGTGHLDLKWANPAATLPLRVNAFATLLQILGSSTMFLSKRGVTQLDGNGKFGLLSLSRLMGLLFNEKEMFGDRYDEAFSDDFLSCFSGEVKTSTKSSSSKRVSRGHVRSSLEFGYGSDGVGAIIAEKNSKSNDSLTLSDVALGSDKKADASPMSALELRDKFLNESNGPKIDTVHDFKTAMQTGQKDFEEDIIHEGQYSGNEVAASWIVAFGGSSAGNNRRWMTAPAPGLSTIQEDTNFDEDKNPRDQKPSKVEGPLDSLDAEIVLSSNSGKKKPVTQFRIPKRSSKSSNDNQSLEKSMEPFADSEQSLDLTAGVELMSIDSEERKLTEKEKRKQQSQTLPVTDADMLKAGTSFLDAIEKSLGLG